MTRPLKNISDTPAKLDAEYRRANPCRSNNSEAARIIAESPAVQDILAKHAPK
jgi:hypothetical protein